MKRAIVEQPSCVACGCCQKVCPLQAIHVEKGLYAAISADCVGCGKCAKACPAGIIHIEQAEKETSHEKALV